VNFWLIRSLPQ